MGDNRLSTAQIGRHGAGELCRFGVGPSGCLKNWQRRGSHDHGVGGSDDDTGNKAVESGAGGVCCVGVARACRESADDLGTVPPTARRRRAETGRSVGVRPLASVGCSGLRSRSNVALRRGPHSHSRDLMPYRADGGPVADFRRAPDLRRSSVERGDRHVRHRQRNPPGAMALPPCSVTAPVVRQALRSTATDPVERPAESSAGPGRRGASPSQNGESRRPARQASPKTPEFPEPPPQGMAVAFFDEALPPWRTSGECRFSAASHGGGTPSPVPPRLRQGH